MKSAMSHTTAIPLDSFSSLACRSTPSVDIQVFLPGYPELPEAALQGDIIVIPDRKPVIPTRRLVVLVPDGEIDENALTRRVWQLAAGSNLKILYLALAPEDSQVAYQRRRLAGLASMTSGEEVRAQVNVSVEKSWPRALEKMKCPGDLLVCLESHQIPDHIVWRRPLGELLAESASVPVFLIGGLKVGPAPHQRQWIKEIQAWTASIALMGAFFGLQVAIDRSSARSLSTILICLSVLVELYFLWKINEWIG